MKQTIERWVNKRAYDELQNHLTTHCAGSVETGLGKGVAGVYHFNKSTVVTCYEPRGAPINLKVTAISEDPATVRETLGMLEGVLR